MARQKKPVETTIIMEGATNTGSSSSILIANQHTGAILIPRKGEVGIALNPLVLAPGQVTAVDADEWNIRKKHPIIQHYLDKGLISEVSKIGPVPVLDATSTDLDAIIPENLKPETQSGDIASAAVTKSSVGSINI